MRVIIFRSIESTYSMQGDINDFFKKNPTLIIKHIVQSESAHDNNHYGYKNITISIFYEKPEEGK